MPQWTTDGSIESPLVSGKSFVSPLITLATNEFVVPKSMPQAKLWRWGAVDCPGSEICNSAIYLVLITIHQEAFQSLLLAAHRT